jgi:RNA polymerase sigma-70 factor, ECF subfamily
VAQATPLVASSGRTRDLRKIARIIVLSPSRSDHDDARDADLLADGRIDRLLATYELVILARCIKETKDVHDGHDVAQDVMFRLFREFNAGKRYEGIPYRVVVHQVTKWTLADFFAGRRTDSPLPDDLELGADDPGERVVSDLWLRDVVAQLPESERAACTLVYLEGLSPEQAAERLGTTRNNIDQRLFHARKRLRELMDDDG